MQKILIFLIGIILSAIGLLYYCISPTLTSSPPEYGSIIIRDSSGREMTDKGLPGGYMIPYTGTLTGNLTSAIIAIEDRRYYSHHGVDIVAKVSSLWGNIRAGETRRGGSTITEQYIKNRFYRGHERTYIQKLYEAIGATYRETIESKENIYRKYLDSIYFGNNIYGLRTALDVYYSGKDESDLTENEILDIITRIKYPNINENTRERATEYKSILRSRLGYTEPIEPIRDYEGKKTYDANPLFTEYVLYSLRSYCEGSTESLIKILNYTPEGICSTSNIDIRTTIERGLQMYAEEVLEKTLKNIETENVTAGAIYIYNPTTKKILAYIGNRKNSQIDMVWRRRSVGSILKPWIYLMALREGAEIESLILDDTRVYPTGIGDTVFVPQNYNPRSYGPIRLREALGNSMNSATVRLSEWLSLGRVYSFMIETGLELEHDVGYYGYGLSLGNIELTLANIVESYSLFINTEDRDVFLIQEILSDSKNRAKTFGMSSILNSSMNLPVKTGTSTDFRDNWTVSYHRDAIIGIWVGNTDGSPMRDVSGVSGAGPIWHQIAEYMIETGLIKKYQTTLPNGLQEAYLCQDKKCLQKERTYLKNVDSIESRPRDDIYSIDDFVGGISDEEAQKWNIQANTNNE